MDRLSELHGEAGSSKESSFDLTSPTSEAFVTANDFTLSEVDSFHESPVSCPDTIDDAVIDPAKSLLTNISPTAKKSDILESYKIGKHIEAQNILSGGVDIFDDNDVSNDGNELVIDDNVELQDDIKSTVDSNISDADSQGTTFGDNIHNNTLSETLIANSNKETEVLETEVVLQIDGKNVNAIAIGTGLYLYRREGEAKELAAVQILSEGEDQQPTFKFLKVR